MDLEQKVTEVSDDMSIDEKDAVADVEKISELQPNDTNNLDTSDTSALMKLAELACDSNPSPKDPMILEEPVPECKQISTELEDSTASSYVDQDTVCSKENSFNSASGICQELEAEKNFYKDKDEKNSVADVSSDVTLEAGLSISPMESLPLSSVEKVSFSGTGNTEFGKGDTLFLISVKDDDSSFFPGESISDSECLNDENVDVSNDLTLEKEREFTMSENVDCEPHSSEGTNNHNIDDSLATDVNLKTNISEKAENDCPNDSVKDSILHPNLSQTNSDLSCGQIKTKDIVMEEQEKNGTPSKADELHYIITENQKTKECTSDERTSVSKDVENSSTEKIESDCCEDKTITDVTEPFSEKEASINKHAEVLDKDKEMTTEEIPQKIFGEEDKMTTNCISEVSSESINKPEGNNFPEAFSSETDVTSVNISEASSEYTHDHNALKNISKLSSEGNESVDSISKGNQNSKEEAIQKVLCSEVENSASIPVLPSKLETSISKPADINNKEDLLSEGNNFSEAFSKEHDKIENDISGISSEYSQDHKALKNISNMSSEESKLGFKSLDSISKGNLNSKEEIVQKVPCNESNNNASIPELPSEWETSISKPADIKSKENMLSEGNNIPETFGKENDEMAKDISGISSEYTQDHKTLNISKRSSEENESACKSVDSLSKGNLNSEKGAQKVICSEEDKNNASISIPELPSKLKSSISQPIDIDEDISLKKQVAQDTVSDNAETAKNISDLSPTRSITDKSLDIINKDNISSKDDCIQEVFNNEKGEASKNIPEQVGSVVNENYESAENIVELPSEKRDIDKKSVDDIVKDNASSKDELIREVLNDDKDIPGNDDTNKNIVELSSKIREASNMPIDIGKDISSKGEFQQEVLSSDNYGSAKTIPEVSSEKGALNKPTDDIVEDITSKEDIIKKVISYENNEITSNIPELSSACRASICKPIVIGKDTNLQEEILLEELNENDKATNNIPARSSEFIPISKPMVISKNITNEKDKIVQEELSGVDDQVAENNLKHSSDWKTSIDNPVDSNEENVIPKEVVNQEISHKDEKTAVSNTSEVSSEWRTPINDSLRNTKDSEVTNFTKNNEIVEDGQNMTKFSKAPLGAYSCKKSEESSKFHKSEEDTCKFKQDNSGCTVDVSRNSELEGSLVQETCGDSRNEIIECTKDVDDHHEIDAHITKLPKGKESYLKLSENSVPSPKEISYGSNNKIPEKLVEGKEYQSSARTIVNKENDTVDDIVTKNKFVGEEKSEGTISDTLSEDKKFPSDSENSDQREMSSMAEDNFAKSSSSHTSDKITTTTKISSPSSFSSDSNGHGEEGASIVISVPPVCRNILTANDTNKDKELPVPSENSQNAEMSSEVSLEVVGAVSSKDQCDKNEYSVSAKAGENRVCTDSNITSTRILESHETLGCKQKEVSKFDQEKDSTIQPYENDSDEKVTDATSVEETVTNMYPSEVDSDSRSSKTKDVSSLDYDIQIRSKSPFSSEIQEVAGNSSLIKLKESALKCSASSSDKDAIASLEKEKETSPGTKGTYLDEFKQSLLNESPETNKIIKYLKPGTIFATDGNRGIKRTLESMDVGPSSKKISRNEIDLTVESEEDDEDKLIIDEGRVSDNRSRKQKKGKHSHSNDTPVQTSKGVKRKAGEILDSEINSVSDCASPNKSDFAKSTKACESAEEAPISNYGRDEICSKCKELWNDDILKMLFEGNESVTINSRITYGAIICMNIYVDIHYPSFKEQALIGLLDRADLAKNLGSIKVSILNSWLVALIKSKKINCCDPFRPIYRMKSSKSTSNATAPENKRRLSKSKSTVEKTGLSPYAVETSKPKTPAVPEIVIDDDEDIENEANLSHTSSSKKHSAQPSKSSSKAKESAQIPIMSSTPFGESKGLPTNCNVYNKLSYKQNSNLYLIVKKERDSLHQSLLPYYDSLVCDTKISDEEIKTLKRKFLSNKEVLNIHAVCILNPVLPNLQNYFKLFVQVLYHRGYSLLVPDVKLLVKQVEYLRREHNRYKLSSSKTKSFPGSAWDEDWLFTAPFAKNAQRQEGYYPTVREILAVFCLHKNYNLITAKEHDKFDLKTELKLLFDPKTIIKDYFGMCVKLYSKYCSLMFESKESKTSKAKLFLNLCYAPKSEQSLLKNAAVIHSSLLLECSGSSSLPDIVTRLENKLVDLSAHPQSEILLDCRMEQTKFIKGELLNNITEVNVRQLLEIYGKLKNELNYLETHLETNKQTSTGSLDDPLAVFNKQISFYTPEMRLMVAKLRAGSVPIEHIPTIIESVFKTVLKRKKIPVYKQKL